MLSVAGCIGRAGRRQRENRVQISTGGACFPLRRQPSTAQNSCGRDPGTLPLLSQSKHRYAPLRKATSAGYPGNLGYNGDIGYIDDVDPDAGELTASFDGRAVTYGFGELDTLVPAYAATIHKSQGSEYPAVVIPVLTQHYAMLQRNLLYTGVTRGKKLVVLVGQKKAVAIAVRNVSGRRRWSKLDEWLSQADFARPATVRIVSVD